MNAMASTQTAAAPPEMASPAHKVEGIPAQTRSQSWTSAQRPGPAAGVALVIHGLNVKPAKMAAIIEVLAGAGVDVLSLALCGHGPNFAPRPPLSDDEARLESMKRVSYGLWKEEVQEAYACVANRSKALGGVPILFVGFSLGGAMGCDLFLSAPEVQYDKMILFAPALAIHGYSYIFRLLAPWPRVVIPSASPQDYRTNRGTSVAAYNALYTAIRSFHRNLDRTRLNIPTLIFIDRQDELVSYRKLARLVRRSQLANWQLHTMQKDAHQYHHLLIDPASAGEDNWQTMVNLMRAHIGMA